jgi:hypothetical protein
MPKIDLIPASKFEATHTNATALTVDKYGEWALAEWDGRYWWGTEGCFQSGQPKMPVTIVFAAILPALEEIANAED